VVPDEMRLIGHGPPSDIPSLLGPAPSGRMLDAGITNTVHSIVWAW
jgi:hypothetical protein